MSTIEQARNARVALACLTEPGGQAVYDLIRGYGPAQALSHRNLARITFSLVRVTNVALALTLEVRENVVSRNRTT